MNHIYRLWGILLKMRLSNQTFQSRYKPVEQFPETATSEENLDQDTYPVDGFMENMDVTTVANMDMTTVATEKPVRTVHPRLLKLFLDLHYKCQLQHDRTPALTTDGPYCNRTMDRFGGCWPDALPGQRVTVQCPELPLGNHKAFVYRDCTENGTWFERNGNEWGNYSQCFIMNDEQPDVTKYIYIFIGGFSLSIVMLIISLIIFFWFRQLRCDRITIHKNLFLSYVFTGLSWILYYVLIALDGNVQVKNPVWCQILHVLCQYFTVCNFLWMFCEGLYLNTIMVYAFTSGKSLIVSCYIIGWGLPCILAIIYGCVRLNDKASNFDCWLGETNLQWIMYGPIVLSIGVNVLFLINIVRLLITKLRQMPEADQTKKATRATLILVPLLGLQYLLFPIRPEPGSNLEDVYHVAVALLISLQGAFVSTMYCFANGEVIQLLKRKWNQHKLMRKNSMRASATHGTSYTTMEPVSQANTTYYSTTCNKEPPLELTKLDDEDDR